ncbi:hypothetical protein CW745_08790 [Psychromonas sp. psych-6C06]|uniref:hypothetical protein n=1 Tax=Psychromonas sp. psych-6C06 TaxID=2058089 RepID=UPI000CC462A9|nr:hypothetical protein [Psychromonas sp. psych-6C06]PKF61424.1 hypothetical protein CW745_08790 [Psychromonas sp. psych-6C06]
MIIRYVICLTLLSMLHLVKTAHADPLPSSSGEGHISMGLEHAHSDNILKSSTDIKSGYEQRANLGASYINNTATNTTILDYTVSYSHYSEESIEDDSDISGSLSINQQLFSENLRLDLSHFRRSYLIDQAGVDLPSNTGDRDVFTASPLWHLPYSDRAGFDTRYTYTTVRFSDDKQQETNRNALSIAWYHHLNRKMTFQFSSEYSEVDFLYYDLTYEQINLNSSFSGRLREGDYLIEGGYSRLALLNRYEEGGIFQLTYNYRFQKNRLSFSAQRELTDSSLGLGEDRPDNGDIDFDGTQLLWIDRVSLDHQFFAFSTRLTNSNSIYYQQETPLLTRKVKPRSGISTQVSWKHTRLLTSLFNAHYSQTTIDKVNDKKQWRSSLSSQYQFHPKLFGALTVQYEEQISNENISGYDEVRLIANIRFSY